MAPAQGGRWGNSGPRQDTSLSPETLRCPQGQAVLSARREEREQVHPPFQTLGFPVMLSRAEKPICHFSCFRAMHRPHTGSGVRTHKRARTRARALTSLRAHRHAHAYTRLRWPQTLPACPCTSLSCCFKTQPFSWGPTSPGHPAGGAPSPPQRLLPEGASAGNRQKANTWVPRVPSLR